jgi:hypothetical protein
MDASDVSKAPSSVVSSILGATMMHLARFVRTDLATWRQTDDFLSRSGQRLNRERNLETSLFHGSVPQQCVSDTDLETWRNADVV